MAEPETFNPCLWIPELCAEPGHSALEELLSLPSPPRTSGRGQRHGRINMELQNTGLFTPRVDREFQVAVPSLLQVCSSEWGFFFCLAFPP